MNISLEFTITTNKLINEENYINIDYNIEETNTNYEYNIEIL